MAECAAYEKAVENAQGVMAEWMETARDLGRPNPEPQGN
ncbi:MAG: type II toxin-antitoxin system HicB family antitoxin [Desulfococcaceae bacterium]